jgi:transposase-like protein
MITTRNGEHMPAPLAPRKRAAILKDIEAGGKPRNQIARDHGVSAGSVTNIAREARIGDAFDRSSTKKATEAAQIDHAAVLAKLAARHAGVAGAILASFEVMGADEWSAVSPHTRAIALGICSDKARELAPADDEAQVDAARSLLNVVFEDIVARHGDDRS